MVKSESKLGEVLVSTPPGVSWTDAPKSRPWLSAPQITSATKLAHQYIGMLGAKESTNDLLDALETNVPLAVFAETIMLGGVSKGIHTIDAGILIMPVIIEVLKTIAEFNNIKYVVFPEELNEGTTVPPRVLRKVIDDMTKGVAATEVAPMAEPVLPEEPTGLMARTKKVGV